MNCTDAKIVLRKNYWDTAHDLELLNDPVTVNLLYIQVVSEIRNGWIPVTREEQRKLEHLQTSGNRKEVGSVCKTWIKFVFRI